MHVIYLYKFKFKIGRIRVGSSFFPRQTINPPQDDPSQVIEEINSKIRQLREQISLQRENKGGLEREVNNIRAQYTTEKKKQQSIKRMLENVRNRVIELDNVEEVSYP